MVWNPDMLTDKKINQLKPKETQYKVADRDGLYLLVYPTGKKTFKFNYRYNNRQETLTIGSYGEITLAQARQELMQARSLLAQGISPARKKQTEARQSKDDTFGAWLERYVADAKVADSTAKMRQYAIQNHLAPALSKLQLSEITDNDVRRLADKLVAEKAPSTALLCRMLIKNVFKYASTHGGPKLRSPTEDVPPSTIHVNMPKTRALAPKEIGYLLNAMDRTSCDLLSTSAVKLALYTLLRKSEVIHATWQEIDWDEKVWRIPKERMKTKRPHNVYLSKQAYDILVCLRTLSTSKSDFIFPAKYGLSKPLANSTPNKLIEVCRKIMDQKGIKFDSCTLHDFRRTGSTILNENGYNSDWIEASLSHVASGIRAVYNVADYAKQRRKMLQDWADMVDSYKEKYKLPE